MQRSFSHKPKKTGCYSNFFDKIETYVAVIAGPAIELHGANPYTFRTVDTAETPSVFKFRDTLTSRAEITDLSAKFANDVVAVIGLGGTGAYVLDYLVKTPVQEIRGFDHDLYHIHNAFRSPGRLDSVELGKSKSAVYRGRYENFRTGLSVKEKFIDASSGDELDGVTFAFVNVDRGVSRAGIFETLLAKKIPFIDVGMGLKRRAEGLSGMLRATHYSVADGERVAKMALAELSDGAEDLYRTNIQIDELNALNAALAVVRFKQIRGFYFDEASTYHVLLQLGTLKTSTIANEPENGAAPGEVHSAAA